MDVVMQRENERGRVAVDGSGSGVEGLDLVALHASQRCGRTLPVRHLVESAQAFEQRHVMGDVIVLCGERVAPDPDVDDDDDDVDDLEHWGCRDCVRYCADCVQEAQRFGAEVMTSSDPGAPAPGGGPDRAL